jgi:CRP-like cAMP-binding protein
MATVPSGALPFESNKLLARLPKQERDRLQPKFQRIPLEIKHILHEADGVIDFVYFPLAGVVSAVTLMTNGTNIEVATIGREGMLSLSAFLGPATSPNRMIVQVKGEALRMEATVFRAETDDDTPLRRLIILYHAAFLRQISQAVACNGLHTVQKRCCRWLLMTHDRAGSDQFYLTHEFLAHMLGVRRASVSEVLKPLQEKGLIRNRQGITTILNRKGLERACCECYQQLENEFARLLG